MRGIRSVAAILAALLLLSACAAVPEIPYDRTEASQIKTIGIVTPRFPDGPSVVLASDIGQSLGLIGALVDAGMRANRESQFGAMLAKRNFSTQKVFIAALSEGLRSQGYTVSDIPATRDGSDFLQNYPPAQVDAYLDVVVEGYGYIAAGISSSLPYRPVFFVRARLARAKDGAVLMQDAVIYNPYGSPNHVVTIAPAPKQGFPDFDSMMADPKDAVGWLQAATDKSALMVDKLLSPTL